MTQSEKTKQFFITYSNSLNGKKKTLEKITKYVEDQKLIDHILFFEKLFPKYEVIIDELMAEGPKIFVRAHFVGTHTGEMAGIPATYKTANTPFALGYEIKNEKIIDFWAIANEMELFEQLGLAKKQVEVPHS